MQFYTSEVHWGDILPRYAFLEPLFADRRVMEIGCGDGSGSRFLLERGAAEVVGIEQAGSALDAARAQAPADGLSYKPFDGSGLDAPSAAFDIVIAFGLGLRMDPALLSEIERVLVPSGFLITALRKPEYRSLGDLGQGEQSAPELSFERFVAGLQDRFQRVSVVAQSPFLGFSIGWMGADAEDLPLEMDSCFVPDGQEDVAYYVAICGREPVSFDSQSLVQLPFGTTVAELAHGSAAQPAPSLPVGPDSDVLQARLERAQASLEARKLENQDLHSRLREQAQLVSQTEDNRDGLKERLAKLEERLADEDRRAESLRLELVRTERLAERLRAELNQRERDEISLRKETLNILVGRSDGDPVSEEDIPEILHRVTEERQTLDLELARLRGSEQKLQDQMEQQAQQFEELKSELALGLRSAQDFKAQAQSNAAEVVEKQSWLEASRGEVGRLENELAERDEQIGAQKKELAALAREKRNRSRKRSDMEVLLSSLRQENKGLKAALEQLGDSIETDRRRRVELEAEKQHLSATLDGRAEQVAELDSQVRAQREELAQKSSEAERLTRRTEELRLRIDALSSGAEKAQEEKIELQSNVESLERRIGLQAEQSEELEQERATLREEVNAREEELRSVRQILSAETGQRAKAESDLSMQSQRNQELESDLVSLVNRLEEGHERDLSRRQASEEMERQFEARERELEDSREKIDDLTRELYSARRQEEDLTAAIDLMRAAVVEQEQARAELDAECANLKLADSDLVRELEGQVKKVQIDLASTRRQLEDRREALVQAEAALEHHRSVSAHQTRELERMSNWLAETQDRMVAAEADSRRVVVLEQDLAWHKEELEKVNSDLQLRLNEFEESGWEIEQIQNELSQTQEDLGQVAKQAKRIRSERNEAQTLAQRLDAERASLAEKLVAVDQHTSEVEQQLRAGQSRLAAFESQIEERDNDLAQAQRKLEDEQNSGRKLSNLVEQQEREFSEREEPLRQELDLAAERERVLQERQAALQKQLTDLESRTSLELSSLGDQMRRREEQMQSLTERLVEVDEKRVWWEQRAGELDDLRQSIQNQASADTEQLTADLARVEQEQAERAEAAESAHKEQQTLIDELRTEASKLEESISELDQEHSRERESHQTRIEELKRELDKREGQLASRAQDQGRADEECQRLRNQMSDLERSFEQKEQILNSRIAEAEAQAQMSAEQIGSLQGQADAANAARQVLDDEAAEIKQRLKQAQAAQVASPAARSGDTGDRAAEVARLEAEVTGARRRIAELEHEMSRTRLERQEMQAGLQRELQQLRAELDRHAAVQSDSNPQPGD